MARPDKATAVAELADRFKSSSATVLTEYRGLSVAQLKELRRSLGEGATYAVVKNTLTKIAAKEAGIEGLDDLLVGPSALAFVDGDIVEAAKSLKTFAKENPALVIKGGYLDAMNASMSQAAALFAAPLSQAARTVDALRVKVETEGPVQDAAAPAADEAPADEAPVAEADAPAAADEAPAAPEAEAEAPAAEATDES